MSDEAPVKRLTAKRKSVVSGIFKGKTTSVEVARQHDLTAAEVERWVEEAERNMENSFGTPPKDVREQYEKELQETREALGMPICRSTRQKSIGACSALSKTREIAAGGAPGRKSSCLAQ